MAIAACDGDGNYQGPWDARAVDPHDPTNVRPWEISVDEAVTLANSRPFTLSRCEEFMMLSPQGTRAHFDAGLPGIPQTDTGFPPSNDGRDRTSRLYRAIARNARVLVLLGRSELSAGTRGFADARVIRVLEWLYMNGISTDWKDYETWHPGAPRLDAVRVGEAQHMRWDF